MSNNNDKQTETTLSISKYFTDDAATVGIRIFRMGGFSESSYPVHSVIR